MTVNWGSAWERNGCAHAGPKFIAHTLVPKSRLSRAAHAPQAFGSLTFKGSGWVLRLFSPPEGANTEGT